MLTRMQFLSGLDGDHWQEVINGQVTRWFDTDGNEITLPDNNGAGVSYTRSEEDQTAPSWYVDPTKE